MSAHKYEMMLIVDPQIEDASVKKLVDKYFEVITDAKGTIDNSDFWGRRKLAYPINDKTEGSYVVMSYTCEPAASAELDRQLKLNDSVLRTKVLHKDVK